MNENSVAEALRALVTSGSKKSETARLRLVFDEIELAFASGVSRESMLETLHTQGFTMALRSFDNAMYRLRKECEAQQVAKPDKPEPMRVHASKTEESPAAAPQGLTPKKDLGSAKPPSPRLGLAGPRKPGEPEKFDWDQLKDKKPEW